MAVFFLASLCIALKSESSYGIVFNLLCIMAMLPAGVDFTLGELVPSYPRSNILRFLTGGLFGIGAGVCVAWCFSEGRILPVALFVTTALLMQLTIAFIFRASGHLDAYVSKYENAVGGNQLRSENRH